MSKEDWLDIKVLCFGSIRRVLGFLWFVLMFILLIVLFVGEAWIIHTDTFSFEFLKPFVLPAIPIAIFCIGFGAFAKYAFDNSEWRDEDEEQDYRSQIGNRILDVGLYALNYIVICFIVGSLLVISGVMPTR